MISINKAATHFTTIPILVNFFPYGRFQPERVTFEIIQWNLDLTKSLGTGQICSLNGGFVISRFFSIHFTVTLAGT